MQKSKHEKGFTLIELLVVISIIGLLVSVVFASFNSVRAKGRDAKRASDIRQVQRALELYYDQNGQYPPALLWFGGTGNCWGPVTDTWVPSVVPNFIPTLPLDPRPTNCASVYLYRSNGTDYKVIAHQPENCENGPARGLKDPARDGGPDGSVVDGNSCWAWAVYTPGAVAW